MTNLLSAALLLAMTVAIATAATTPPSTTGKILFVASVGSKSHKNFYDGIIGALAKEGHQVTILTPYPDGRTIINVREIVIEENDMDRQTIGNFFTGGKLSTMMQMMKLGPELCINALTSNKTKAVLKEEFDLAYVSVFFSDCFLPHINEKKIPFALVNPAEMFSVFGSRIGNVAFPSFDYNPMFGYKNPQSFLQRAITTVSNVIMETMMNYADNSLDRTCRSLGLYPETTPYMPEIYANTSLMIANSFRLAEHPRPYMPNILLAGGIHCKPSKPLPKDLEDWASSSGEAGFIYFSLGSAVRPSDVPVETVQTILSVFKSLPQKVLWKYNLDQVAGGLPDNVKLTKWAPQQDLLGHPRLRLFITHGGLFSTQESLYHGVPVLGLPVFGDQEGNMMKAEMQGWGKKLSWEELKYDNFKSTILNLINNKEARSIAKRLGDLNKDRPMNPADEVAWWAGYLIRTKGAPHLRSGALELSWYQLYNVDVWSAIVLVTVLLLWLTIKLFVMVYRRCCAAKKKAPEKTEKKLKKK